MSLSITLNRNAIMQAYKKCVNGPCNSWALFSYVPGTKDELELVSEGTEGLEEIYDEFSEARIMYALVKVEDPKTTLAKIAYINWQGECVSGIMRGRAANHVSDFSRMFKGINLTVHARNEDDVDPELILAEISRASATNYDFKIKPMSMSGEEVTAQPVGTNYKPIKPQTAIPRANDRNSFWAQEQKKEQERIKADEQRSKEKEIRAQEDLKKADQESRKRINKEYKNKSIELANLEKPQDIHIKTRESTSSVSVMNTSQTLQSPVSNPTYAPSQADSAYSSSNKTKSNHSLQSSTSTTISTTNKSISPRNNTVFAQMNTSINTSSMSSTSNPFKAVQSVHAPVSPPRKASTGGTSSLSVAREASLAAGHDDHEEMVQSTTAVKTNVGLDNLNQGQPLVQPSSFVNSVEEKKEYIPEPVTDCEVAPQVSRNLKARAIYDYTADDETEITFLPGDIIEEIDQFDEGWWTGKGPDGKIGMFPANYVSLL